MSLTWIDADTYLSRVSARDDAMNHSIAEMMEEVKTKPKVRSIEDEMLIVCEAIQAEKRFNVTDLAYNNNFPIARFREFLEEFAADNELRVIYKSGKGTTLTSKRLNEPPADVKMTLRMIPINEKFSVYKYAGRLHMSADLFYRHLYTYAQENGLYVDRVPKVGTWLRRTK